MSPAGAPDVSMRDVCMCVTSLTKGEIAITEK